MKRLLVVALLCALSSCVSDAPSPVGPDVGSGPLYSIADGATGGGHAGFRWLPPLVRSGPALDGTFAPGVLPHLSVEICAWDGASCLGGSLHVFDSDGTGSEHLRLDDEGAAPHFIVNWHTAADELDSETTYRIRVLAGGIELGHADVNVAGSGRELRDVNTGEFVALLDGRTLPIKFWVSDAVGAPVGPAGGTFLLNGGAVIVNVPPGAVSSPVLLSAEPTTTIPSGSAPIPGTIFELGPNGTQFAQPIAITVPYDPAQIPAGLPEEALRLYVAEGPLWTALDGEADTSAKTITGYTTHFSTFGGMPLVQFCPGRIAPTAFGTFAAALTAMRPGGTIEVCDGTHTVEGVVLNEGVRIRPEAGASPVLATQNSLYTFSLDGFLLGTVEIDGLTFSFSTPTGPATDTRSYPIRAAGTYKDVIIRNVTFDIDPAARGSIFLWTNVASSSNVFIENATFNGGVLGVAAFDTGDNSRFEVRNSRFGGVIGTGVFLQEANAVGRVEGSTFANCYVGRCVAAFSGAHVDVVSNAFDVLDYSGTVAGPPFQTVFFSTGTTGLVEGNTFLGCGRSACIGVSQADVEVFDNDIRLDQLPEGSFGIHAILVVSSTADIRDNAILAPPGDTDPASWTLLGGILVSNSTAEIHGNFVNGARRGVFVGGPSVVPSAEDNFIATTEIAFGVADDATVNFNRNNAFNSLLADLAGTNLTNMGLGSDLTCNWWNGGAPVIFGGPFDASVYTPWATAPIAGTGATGCTPGPGGVGADASTLVVSQATRPTVSPDGLTIAFEVRNGVDPDHIATVPATGGVPTALTAMGAQPDWQTNGDLIVFRGNDQSSLWTVDASTQEVSFLATGNIDDDPAWSPDDTEIAVEGSTPDAIEIFPYPAGMSTPVPCVLANQQACSGEHPTWSPDGSTLAFYQSGQLVTVPRTGGTPTLLLNGIAADPMWSPDGLWIAFAADSQDPSDCAFVPGGPFPVCAAHIWVVSASGPAGGLFEVTDGRVHDSSPTWSPDSSALFFERSALSGSFESSVRRIDFNAG